MSHYFLLIKMNMANLSSPGIQLEKWLEKILSKCHDTISSKRTALECLGIDRKELLRLGISHTQINNMYRSLFVFSKGSHDILFQYESLEHTLPTRLWNVFTRLLEHCEPKNTEFLTSTIRNELTDRMTSESLSKSNLLQQLNEEIGIISDQFHDCQLINVSLDHQLQIETIANFSLQSSMEERLQRQGDMIAMEQDIASRLRADLAIMTNRCEISTTSAAKLEIEIGILKAKVSTCETELTAVSDKFITTVMKLTSLESKSARDESDISRLKNKIKRLADQISDAELDSDAAKTCLAEARSTSDALLLQLTVGEANFVVLDKLLQGALQHIDIKSKAMRELEFFCEQFLLDLNLANFYVDPEHSQLALATYSYPPLNFIDMTLEEVQPLRDYLAGQMATLEINSAGLHACRRSGACSVTMVQDLLSEMQRMQQNVQFHICKAVACDTMSEVYRQCCVSEDCRNRQLTQHLSEVKVEIACMQQRIDELLMQRDQDQALIENLNKKAVDHASLMVTHQVTLQQLTYHKERSDQLSHTLTLLDQTKHLFLEAQKEVDVLDSRCLQQRDNMKLLQTQHDSALDDIREHELTRKLLLDTIRILQGELKAMQHAITRGRSAHAGNKHATATPTLPSARAAEASVHTSHEIDNHKLCIGQLASLFDGAESYVLNTVCQLSCDLHNNVLETLWFADKVIDLEKQLASLILELSNLKIFFNREKDRLLTTYAEKERNVDYAMKNFDDMKSQRDKLQVKTIEMAAVIASLNSSIDILRAKELPYLKEIDDLTSANEAMKSKMESLKIIMTAAETRAKLAAQKLEKLQFNYDLLSSKHATLVDENESMTDKMTKLSQNLQRMQDLHEDKNRKTTFDMTESSEQSQSMSSSVTLAGGESEQCAGDSEQELLLISRLDPGLCLDTVDENMAWKQKRDTFLKPRESLYKIKQLSTYHRSHGSPLQLNRKLSRTTLTMTSVSEDEEDRAHATGEQSII